MFRDIRKRARSAGLPPGTAQDLSSPGKKTRAKLTVVNYTLQACQSWEGEELENCPLLQNKEGLTWINVQGITPSIVSTLSQKYQLHPLTTEDIINMTQRPKVEEFPDYEFIALKILGETKKSSLFHVDQICLVLGDGFVLSFTSRETSLFAPIYERLQSGPNQRLRQHAADYLVYRILDTVVDQYFVVLETIGNLIDAVEEQIISDPQPQNTRSIYRLKKKMLLLRKSIWPAREVISHLLQVGEKRITAFTRLYLRDLYDHIVLAVDSVEIFRDMLTNMLDIYLSSLTNRMNEVMKTLTIIATIFIPMTFIASLYGMNFKYMPELNWHWGYAGALGMMGMLAAVMLIYFRSKKWL